MSRLIYIPFATHKWSHGKKHEYCTEHVHFQRNWHSTIACNVTVQAPQRHRLGYKYSFLLWRHALSKASKSDLSLEERVKSVIVDETSSDCRLFLTQPVHLFASTNSDPIEQQSQAQLHNKRPSNKDRKKKKAKSVANNNNSKTTISTGGSNDPNNVNLSNDPSKQSLLCGSSEGGEQQSVSDGSSSSYQCTESNADANEGSPTAAARDGGANVIAPTTGD